MTATISVPNAHEDELPQPSPKPTSVDGQAESSRDIWVSPDGRFETGIWECSPGTFTATRDGYDEVATILVGSATVTDSHGVVTEIGPGSVLVTPAGWSGSVSYTHLRAHETG
jgi:uncharacterized cupin superfamily protein